MIFVEYEYVHVILDKKKSLQIKRETKEIFMYNSSMSLHRS